MLWIFMALLAILAAGSVMRRRRSYESVDDEPWRASLQEEEGPLDLDEIRRAEDEWLEGEAWGDSDEEEEWR